MAEGRGKAREREEPDKRHELLAMARDRGFVTLEEVYRALNPRVEPSDIANLLTSAGVAVVKSEPSSDFSAGTGTERELLPDAIGEESRPAEELSVQPRPRREVAEIDSELTESAVGMYLREIDRVPLLKAEEEVMLAKRIEEGRNAEDRLAQGEPSQELSEQLEKLIADSLDARRHLTEANLRLVVSVAKRYIGRGLPLLDLIQEGNIGLNRAIDHFDYHRGFRFSTYAHWWIRQGVTRAIAEQSRTIRVPVHVIDLITAFFRKQHELQQQLGRDPTRAELADALGTTPERVHEIVRASRRPISLETPIGIEGERLGDLVADSETVGPAEIATLGSLRQHVEEAMAALTDREQTVLRLRFGLTDGRDRTLAEIADELGVSRERARQLEADALRKLRQPELRQRLKEYLEE